MNETQKAKNKFRTSREWRTFKQAMKEKCGKIDGITQKKLYKTWNLHHRNLDESQYTNLREDWFFPCNNMTHKFLHWLWNYYKDLLFNSDEYARQRAIDFLKENE